MNRREAIERTALILGYAVSAPAIMGILKGCKAAPELNYKPVFLTVEQASLVGDIAEVIIPKTETPGAKDVGVPSFIDLILKDAYSKEDQDRFLKGLQEFDDETKKMHGNSFAELEPSMQKEMVKRIHDPAVATEKAAHEKENGNAPKKPFILMVKELTLLGFFTSEPGATVVLQYDPVPGAYHGCLPLSEVGKAWATS